MTETEIIIDSKGDSRVPKKMTIEADSSFFKEGDIIEFPSEISKASNYTAIKITKVTKKIIVGIVDRKTKIIVYAERCF